MGRGGEARGGEACTAEDWALPSRQVGVRRIEGCGSRKEEECRGVPLSVGELRRSWAGSPEGSTV